MPIRSDWRLQREGITIDTLDRLVKRTLLNPTLTLPLILLARYTRRGRFLTTGHETALRCLKTLLFLGLLRRISNFLDTAVLNNWQNDVYNWEKEIVVVTGGSDGIGSIVVKLLAEKGIKVAVLDIQPLTYEAPSNVHYYECDLNSPTAISSIAASIRNDIGSPTILVNNAGFARGKTILDSSESDIRLTFNINTLSHYFLAKAFLPSMIENNHGMVVTIASLAAYVTAPQMVDYAASKAAALAFHEGLTAELATTYKAPKVRTVVVCQGYTRTKLFQGFDEGDGMLSYVLQPETVAEEVVKAILAGRSKHIVLPASSWYMAVQTRGWPLWMQVGMRKGLVKLMKDWRGRQVVQPSEDDQPAKRVRFASSQDELSRDDPEHRPQRTPRKTAAVKATTGATKKSRLPIRVQPRRGVKKAQLEKRVGSPADTLKAAGKRKRVISPQASTIDAAERTPEVPRVKRPRGRPRKEPEPQEVRTQGESKGAPENGSHPVNGPKQEQTTEAVILREFAVENFNSKVPATSPQSEVTAGERFTKKLDDQEHNQPARTNTENGPIPSDIQQVPTPMSSLAQNAPAPLIEHPDSHLQKQAVCTTASVSAAEDSQTWSEEGVPPANDPCLALAFRHLELGISTWREVDLTQEIKLSEGILHPRSGAGYEWERRYEMRLGME